MSDFPSDIVNQVSHRPWPLPDGPWIMTQSWHDLLFAHFSALIDVEHRDGYVHYNCRRPESAGEGASGSRKPCAQFTGRYRPAGPVHEALPGTLDYFLTERYCLYTLDSSFHLQRLEIHHPPWQLQPAEADLQVNTMADAAGMRLPSMAPVLHFSRRQDMVAWPLMRVE